MTMTAPTTAVVLRRSRRRPCANGDSERSAGAGHAAPPTTGSSASPTLPPRIGEGTIPSDSRRLLIASSGVPDPRIQEGVGQVHEQVDHHERDGRDEREALHLLIVARD